MVLIKVILIERGRYEDKVDEDKTCCSLICVLLLFNVTRTQAQCHGG